MLNNNAGQFVSRGVSPADPGGFALWTQKAALGGARPSPIPPRSSVALISLSAAPLPAGAFQAATGQDCSPRRNMRPESETIWPLLTMCMGLMPCTVVETRTAKKPNRDSAAALGLPPPPPPFAGEGSRPDAAAAITHCPLGAADPSNFREVRWLQATESSVTWSGQLARALAGSYPTSRRDRRRVIMASPARVMPFAGTEATPLI